MLPTEKKAERAEERTSAITINRNRTPGFTMVELIIMIAIIGLLLVMVSPKVSWMEPPKRILQRALLEAVETAQTGASIRFRAEKAAEGESGSFIIPEALVKGDGESREGSWVTLKMDWMPAGDRWTIEPDIIYFFQDGTCTPAKLQYGEAPEAEKFMLSVAGYLIDVKQ